MDQIDEDGDFFGMSEEDDKPESSKKIPEMGNGLVNYRQALTPIEMKKIQSEVVNSKEDQVTPEWKNLQGQG